jgi:hypothetical protein
MPELNDFVKEIAERLLPLAGDNVQVCSFLAGDVFTSDVSEGQIELILSDVFNHARESMQPGGIVFVRTGNAATEADTELSTVAEMPCYIALTLELTALPSVNNRANRPQALLGKLRQAVEDTRGFICFNQMGPEKNVIEIYWPVLQRALEFKEYFLFGQPKETQSRPQFKM